MTMLSLLLCISLFIAVSFTSLWSPSIFYNIVWYVVYLVKHGLPSLFYCHECKLFRWIIALNICLPINYKNSESYCIKKVRFISTFSEGLVLCLWTTVLSLPSTKEDCLKIVYVCLILHFIALKLKKTLTLMSGVFPKTLRKEEIILDDCS